VSLTTSTNEVLVTVVLPVFNGEPYLAEAIDSVLAQNHPAIEVIAIDDGSTDGTAHILESYRDRLRFERQPNRGAGAARNRGVELARGELLGFLDADDIWVDGRVARQVAVLAAQPECEAVLGWVEHFHSPELDAAQRARIVEPAAGPGAFHAGTMLIRRSSFLRAGYLPTEYKLGEFIDWYLRAQEAGLQFVTQPEVALRRRLHMGHVGLRERQYRSDYARILKAAMDRRRAKETRS
jgi:glycosyltransferase involved in cell wall biosynthesis